MTSAGFKRKLTAILSADVEGYSRLMGEDEEATVRTLTTYRTAMSDLVQQYRGRVVDTTGDNLMAEFTSVVDAVNCAVEIQRDLAERNAELPYNRKMEFRIGVNLGDVIDEEGRIYGDGVNIAARVEAMAEAGGICISGRAYDQVANKLGLEYDNLGEHQAKNISTPIRVYRVLSFPGAAAHRVVQAKEAVNKKWRNLSIAVGAVVVVAVVVGIWQFYLRRPSIEPVSVDSMAFPLPQKPSVAVLPFTNISGDPKQDYISDGLTEQIITSLSKIPHLFVIARNSTFTYKGKPVKVQQVAEDLGIRYVLEGSVQTSDEQIRITAQLIDAITGNHLWAEHYDRNLQDIFALQDEITLKVITSLQIKLTEGEYAHTVARSTNTLRALEYFWKAEYHFMRITRDENELAKKWLEKALEADPNFSSAWALMGFVQLINLQYGWSKSTDYAFKSMEEYAQKALSLDDSNPKAHCLMSNIHFLHSDFDQAIVSGEKSVALAPNDHNMLGSLAFILVYAGKHEEAVSLAKKAMRLNPYYEDYFLECLGDAYFFLGQYEESLNAYKNLIDRNPQYGMNHIKLAGVYSELGREEEAKTHAAEALRSNPNFSIEGLSRELPLKNQADENRRRNALLKAGFK